MEVTVPVGFEEWLASRPECIRKLAAEFPLGSTFDIDGTLHWLLGYNESDMLILTPIDPAENFKEANEARVYVCADHYRAANTSKEQHK